MFEEIWDSITDGWDMFLESLSYIFTFEWIGDAGELFSSMFENLNEFSVIGLTFGLVGAGTVYFARDYMLTPFLKYMSPLQAGFWGIATYIGCFVGGYMVGKYFENTG